MILLFYSPILKGSNFGLVQNFFFKMLIKVEVKMGIQQ